MSLLQKKDQTDEERFGAKVGLDGTSPEEDKWQLGNHRSKAPNMLAAAVRVSPDDAVYLVQLSKRIGRWEDMWTHAIRMVELRLSKYRQMTRGEYELLDMAFNKVVGERRQHLLCSASTRCLLEKQRTRKPGQIGNADVAAEKLTIVARHRSELRGEVERVCFSMMRMVERIATLPHSTPATNTSHHKLRADALRYMAYAGCVLPRGQNILRRCIEAYQDGTRIARWELPPCDRLRMKLAINYSVALATLDDDLDAARQISKLAFDEAVRALPGVAEEDYRETIFLIHHLRDNARKWSDNARGTSTAVVAAESGTSSSTIVKK